MSPARKPSLDLLSESWSEMGGPSFRTKGWG
jgi:hypothetical protein